MKKTKLFAILFCFVLAVASFGFAACAPKTDDTDKTSHHYSEIWTSDENEHYHKCTDEGCTEVADKAAHTFTDNVCTVCGYKKAENPDDPVEPVDPVDPTKPTEPTNPTEPNPKYTAFVQSVTELEPSEGFTVSLSDWKYKQNNMSSQITTGEDEEDFVIVIGNADINVDFELFVGKDAEGAFIAKGRMLFDGVYYNADKAKQPEYADVISTATLNATFVVENETIYFDYAMNAEYNGIPAAYRAFNEEKESKRGSMTFEEFIEYIYSQDDVNGSISGGIGNDDTFGGGAIGGVIGGNPVGGAIGGGSDDETMSGTSPAYMTIALFSALPEMMKSLLPEDWNDENTALAITSAFDKALSLGYKVTETADGYAISPDFDKIKTLLTDLADLSVAEYLDKYVLEGHYDDVCAFINDALDYNVEFIVGKLDEIGVDINALVKKMNDNFALVEGIGGGETMTVEKMFGLPEGMTVKDFLLSEGIKDLTIADAIEAMLANVPNMPQGVTAKELVGEILENLKTTSFLETIITPAQYPNLSEEQFAAEFKKFVQTYKLTLSGEIDVAAAIASPVLYVDENGNFISYVIDVKVDKKVVDLMETLLEELKKINPDATENNGDISESIKNLEVTAKITVTKGKFTNALGFDYDGFVKSFTEPEIA